MKKLGIVRHESYCDRFNFPLFHLISLTKLVILCGAFIEITTDFSKILHLTTQKFH